MGKKEALRDNLFAVNKDNMQQRFQKGQGNLMSKENVTCTTKNMQVHWVFNFLIPLNKSAHNHQSFAYRGSNYFHLKMVSANTRDG